MIEGYKRFVLWNCRALQHIPGYRTYGAWMERQYTKRFWTTVIWNMVAGAIFNVMLQKALNRLLFGPPEPDPICEYCNSPFVRDPNLTATEDRWCTHECFTATLAGGITQQNV